MPRDYFIHVGNGPPSFALFDFGVYCLLFNFLFATNALHNVFIPFYGKTCPFYVSASASQS